MGWEKLSILLLNLKSFSGYRDLLIVERRTALELRGKRGKGRKAQNGMRFRGKKRGKGTVLQEERREGEEREQLEIDNGKKNVSLLRKLHSKLRGERRLQRCG